MRYGLNTVVVGLAALIFSQSAFAGGYDTPILYSARHMGMGGAAVAYVDDASAIFHNPAGLARTTRWSVLGDFSPLIGSIQGSPATNPVSGPINTESETSFAPFFMLGVSFQPLPWLAIGLAAYPVASAGATYVYENTGGTTITDYTKLFFLEIAPGIAFSLPGRVTLGATYRITLVSLDRTQTPEGGDPTLDLDMSGWNFAGFRVGAQWEAIRNHLSIGLMYRHLTRTEIEADEITAFGLPAYDATSEFSLPSQLVFGARGDYAGFGLAVDVAIGFNSQNDSTTIEANTTDNDFDTRAAFYNVFEWTTAVTVRAGLEYDIRLGGDQYILTPRLGYIFDGKTSNEGYPTAFGTPPSPTNTITFGLGFDGGPWEINLAYAYRFGGTTVESDDIGDRTCNFCSFPGEYDIALHGLYIDLSMDLGPRGHNPRDRRGEDEEPVVEETADTEPVETVPEETVPEETAPVETAPEETAPEETVSDDEGELDSGEVESTEEAESADTGAP